MALAKEEGYLELDVKPAARWWLAPNGRNFGLSLEVEDVDGQRKPAASYFRARNCSFEGSVLSERNSALSKRQNKQNKTGLMMDELTDVRDVVSPVLELTVVEVPEGRPIVELPGLKSRSDEVDNGEESEQTGEQDDPPRRQRNQRAHDEQSDEAGRFAHRPPVRQQRPRARLAPAPVPTLATLEDHDLFREPSADDGDQPDESRLSRKPANLFIQRIVQHHQRQRAGVQ